MDTGRQQRPRWRTSRGKNDADSLQLLSNHHILSLLYCYRLHYRLFIYVNYLTVLFCSLCNPACDVMLKQITINLPFTYLLIRSSTVVPHRQFPALSGSRNPCMRVMRRLAVRLRFDGRSTAIRLLIGGH